MFNLIYIFRFWCFFCISSSLLFLRYSRSDGWHIVLTTPLYTVVLSVQKYIVLSRQKWWSAFLVKQRYIHASSGLLGACCARPSKDGRIITGANMRSAIISRLKRITLKSVWRRELRRVLIREIAEYLKRMALKYLRFGINGILNA